MLVDFKSKLHCVWTKDCSSYSWFSHTIFNQSMWTWTSTHSFLFPGLNPGNGGNSRGSCENSSRSRGSHSRPSGTQNNPVPGVHASFPLFGRDLLSFPGLPFPGFPDGSRKLCLDLREILFADVYNITFWRFERVVWALNEAETVVNAP